MENWKKCEKLMDACKEGLKLYYDDFPLLFMMKILMEIEDN